MGAHALMALLSVTSAVALVCIDAQQHSGRAVILSDQPLSRSEPG